MEVPEEGVSLHALVVPHPLQGHITPLLQLSQKLASAYGVRVTFVVTNHALHLMGSASQVPSYLSLKIMGVPDNLPVDHPRMSNFGDAYDSVMGMESSVDHLLSELAIQGQSPSFILADTFVTWANRLARKHNVPYVAFATTNTYAVAVMSSTAKLISLGMLPLKNVNGSFHDADKVISCIPGVPPLHPDELPMSMRGPTVTHYRMEFLIDQFKQVSMSTALLVNSTYELEKDVLEGLELNVPVYAAGPALILNGLQFALDGPSASLWQPEHECLLWLDKQVAGHVLYVSFGSVATLDEQQFMELALGLEASQQPFLWVIRPESCKGSLPSNYVDRIKDRGMIISWAPQHKVLAHPATGGFMTHCGWNSVSENLCLGGVPMICWPFEAEQGLNCKVITEVWKVGIKVQHRGDGVVHQNEIKRVIQVLMQDEGAKLLKSKVQQMRKVVNDAVQDGGSSLRNIEAVLRSIRHAVKTISLH